MNAHPVHQEFQRKLEACTVKPDWPGGRDFIQVERFTSWMRAKALPEQTTNIQRLLKAVYQNRIQPISASKISDPGDDCCVLVFSILLEIGLGYFINEVQNELVDYDLPQTLDKLKDIFRPIRPTMFLEYAEMFNSAQWKFRPMKFRWDMQKVFPEEYIIPICRKREIGRGGQGRVYGIVVQDEYVCDRLHEALSLDEHTRYHDPDYGECFQLALKTYQDGKIAEYNDEKCAFDGMKNTKGIIRYLGTYGHKEKLLVTNGNNEDTYKTVVTRHILLEYGEYSLMQIFMYRLPPVFALEIKNFWTSLIKIVDALKGIHKLKTENGEWSGWHNDIKPGNIIVVDGDYKLADPGFAKFKRKLEKDPNSIPTIVAEGGTRTYAAPECYARRRDFQVHVTQSVDIWSVGCVLSMAATWLVLGYQGIGQFRIIRQKAIDSLVRQQQNATSGGETIMHGDFFHNGREVLPEVKQWHLLLRNSIRKTDHITSALLDLVETRLLIAVDFRISAEELYTKLQRLIGETEVEETDPEMDALMKTLVEIDQNAPSTPAEWRSTTIKAQASQDTVHLNDPRVELRKTASRFEALSKVTRVMLDNVGSSTPVHQQHRHSCVYSPPVDRSTDAVNHHRMSSTSLSPSPFRSRSIIGTQRPANTVIHQPQNAIQAREQFGNTNWVKMLKRGDADLVLKAYFDNRDIKFLVDNASSMGPYWDEATFLLETLVNKASPFDPDGMDLYFTLGKESVTREKGSNAFRRSMGRAKPSNLEVTSTDMTRALERIFEAYFNTVQERRRRKKSPKEDLTLIVLTDGVWDATDDKEEVGQYIVTIMKRLEQLDIGGFKKRPVSIEFVQLGNDDDATERLRALDDDMPVKGYKDIIDHEMFSIQGDVRKMLLGSFVPSIDNSEFSPTRTNSMASLASGATSNRNSMYGASSSAYSPPAAAYTNRASLQNIYELPSGSHNRMHIDNTHSSTYRRP